MRLTYVAVTAIKIGALVQVQTVKYLKNRLDKLAIDFGVNLVLIQAFVCSHVIANLAP
jgi:hydroxymethylpyrimidine/phosphomethylpyrimidine kinase